MESHFDVPSIEDEIESFPCEACPGVARFLGLLGDRAILRCRDCGLDYNIPVERD